MTVKRLDSESEEYVKAREKLLKAEIELKDHVERVAELRRSLPQGAAVDDYEFHECKRSAGERETGSREVRLSELFTDPSKPLIIDHFMYGGSQTEPCPMCTMWADGYDAIVPHIEQRANFAVVAEAEIDRIHDHARTRGWKNLRLVSSHGTSFKTDFKMQDADGGQHPGIAVFTRDDDGTIRHFYTGEAIMGEGHWRGVDLLSPVWHLFDLLPGGRGDWFPKLSYR